MNKKEREKNEQMTLRMQTFENRRFWAGQMLYRTVTTSSRQLVTCYPFFRIRIFTISAHHFLREPGTEVSDCEETIANQYFYTSTSLWIACYSTDQC